VTGGPATAWGVWPRGAVTVTGKRATYHSSPGVARSFCPTCGASVSFEAADEADAIAIALGLLVRPGEVVPTDQTFLDDALPHTRIIAPARRWPGAVGIGTPLGDPAI